MEGRLRPIQCKMLVTLRSRIGCLKTPSRPFEPLLPRRKGWVGFGPRRRAAPRRADSLDTTRKAQDNSKRHHAPSVGAYARRQTCTHFYQPQKKKKTGEGRGGWRRRTTTIAGKIRELHQNTAVKLVARGPSKTCHGPSILCGNACAAAGFSLRLKGGRDRIECTAVNE